MEWVDAIASDQAKLCPANSEDRRQVKELVIWDGQYRTIDIAASETEPLLGMAMLYAYRLQVDNIEGGIVKIKALRS